MNEEITDKSWPSINYWLMYHINQKLKMIKIDLTAGISTEHHPIKVHQLQKLVLFRGNKKGARMDWHMTKYDQTNKEKRRERSQISYDEWGNDIPNLDNY